MQKVDMNFMNKPTIWDDKIHTKMQITDLDYSALWNDEKNL